MISQYVLKKSSQLCWSCQSLRRQIRLARVGSSWSSQRGIGSELVTIQLHVVNEHRHQDAAGSFFRDLVLVKSRPTACNRISSKLTVQSSAQAAMNGFTVFFSEPLDDSWSGEFLSTEFAKACVSPH